MKKNLLFAGLLTTFSLVAKSQVGIHTSNPQGVFNIDGLKNNPTTGVPTAVQAADDLVMTSNGNLGLGLTAPGTTLDVKGAITNRETALAVAGNAVTIPANVSLVRLTGAATANVAISAFAAPNPGQRLIVYNNTTGGFDATLDGTTIPNGKALEFIFSNSFWRSTGSVNLYTADGTLAGNRTVTQGANTLAFTGTQTNAFSVDGNTLSVDAANNRLGIGTTAPDTKLTISTPDNSFGLNHTNGTVNLKTYIGGGEGYLGTTTSNALDLMTNNTVKMKITPSGNVGVGTSTPGTTLDVNGAITNRETVLAVAGNAVTIPANVSLVRLTGAATANVAITAPAAPNPGQRLIVYNGTTGGFGATLDVVTIPNNTAMEFVFTNSFWRPTDGGMLVAGPTNIYTANGTLAGNRVVTTAGNSLSFTNGSNNVYVGTTGTEGTVKATGSSRGSFVATGGGAALNMYVDNNAMAQITTTGTNTGMDLGATTADPVNIITNNTQRVTVTGTGNVGIGTNAPATKLDINGNLRIGTTTGSSSSNNVATLVRDNTTGEVKVAMSTTGNRSPINMINYTLSNVNGDYISDYDTKINIAEYTVIVVGIYFSQLLKVVSPETPQPYFAPFNVIAFEQNSTWHLNADYPNTASSSNGTWVINCLVINNSLIKILTNVNQDLGGSNIGAAAAQPSGL
jgi:hypothetical protein